MRRPVILCLLLILQLERHHDGQTGPGAGVGLAARGSEPLGGLVSMSVIWQRRHLPPGSASGLPGRVLAGEHTAWV